MVLDVIFDKLLPTTASIIAFTTLWAMGEREGALIVLSTGALLQILWLYYRYGKRR